MICAAQLAHGWRRAALRCTEVARRLGVSDVALAKLCRNATIPIPHRGYWAKVNAGQVVERMPLPPPPNRLPQLLRILGRNSQTKDSAAIDRAGLIIDLSSQNLSLPKYSTISANSGLQSSFTSSHRITSLASALAIDA